MDLIQKLGPWAFVDLFIITAIIYRLLLLLRGTRAMQMVLGILLLAGFVFFLSYVYPLTTLKWLMDKFYSSIFIVIVILFQEDIRRVLSRVGKKTVFQSAETISSQQMLDELMRAATALTTKKFGALIVIERDIILTRYVDIGILIDGRITKELLVSIFHPSSPIHDGAVIVQQGRIAAAGCFLPLTRDDSVDPELGTRHRAAIGVSQETDALVLVISEENQAISLVVDGNVSRNLGPRELRKVLRNLLSQKTNKPSNTKKKKKKSSNSNWNQVIERMKIFRSGGSK
ncbi:MAG: TIGR00159 family protein [Pseudobacteriovorax sp.]|nr:TIGR00159 family protein [Pseudobacteriovorax sp.]